MLGFAKVARRIAACAAAFAALLYAACLRPLRYPCDDHDACERDGAQGICEAGWCAYEDEDCPSGYRWSSIADESLASMCVPGHGDESSGSTTTESGTSSETSTSSTTDAGSSSTGVPDCESYCIAGPHSTAMCDEAGECIVTCEPPWENCDGDVATGCEVPVGVAHQCDQDGLDPVEGCWTAYCGESESATANFGTYYCMDCVTCEEPTAGNCHWCDHDTGHWFPVAACACGGDLGVVCGP